MTGNTGARLAIKPHRRSLRLAHYDYSQAGRYFVTVCIEGRRCLLGEIVDEEMRLNDVGKMVEKWWKELENKFPSIEIDAFMTMPNHFHGILVIDQCPGTRRNVGAALRGRPEVGHPRRGAPTLGDIMDWFKTMSTNGYIREVKTQGWPPFSGRLWQRNYYEHVIRNEHELNSIREYIELNPTKWAFDRENPDHPPGAQVPASQKEIEKILGCLP